VKLVVKVKLVVGSEQAEALAEVVRDNGQTESVSDLTVGEGAMFFSQSGALKLVRCIAKPKATSSSTGTAAPAAA
jgi:hypothetical protein